MDKLELDYAYAMSIINHGRTSEKKSSGSRRRYETVRKPKSKSSLYLSKKERTCDRTKVESEATGSIKAH